MKTVTLHPTPSSTVDAITDDPILTDRILSALREHYVIVRRFGGDEDTYTSESAETRPTVAEMATEMRANERLRLREDVERRERGWMR